MSTRRKDAVDFSQSQRVTRSTGRPPATEKTLGQLKVDELCYLKKSKSGHLGYLSRIYREMETLMLDPCNLNQVMIRKQTLDNAYNNCVHVHEKYFLILDDDNEKSDALQAYEQLVCVKRDFDNYYEQWIDRFNSPARHSTHSIEQQDLITKSPTRIELETRSEASIDSMTEAVDRLELEYKRLVRQTQLQREIADIKNEQLNILKDIKQKEIEIERATNNKGIPSARCDVEDDQDSVKSVLMTPSCFKLKWTKDLLPQPEPMTSTPHTDVNTNQDFKEDPVIVNESKLSSHVSTTSELVERKDLELLLKQQQEAMSLMATSLRVGFEMPKKELLTFDGNPVNYWTFIKNFEINIERQLTDADSKLTYLIQQCSGKAREAIKNCIIIDDKEKAYEKAKEILHSRYGQKHVIAHAYINRLVNGPQLKSSDAAGLTELASQMQNCQLTLASMGFEADINSSDNLVKVVKRLPVHLQGKWADKAGTLIARGTEPNFEHLTKFIDERATLANTMYGMIVGSAPDRDIPLNRYKNTLGRRQPNFGHTTKATTLATHAFESTPADIQTRDAKNLTSKCPMCSGPHKLTRCEKFKEKTPQQRREFTMQARLCHNCLGRNHLAANCRSDNTCRVQGCGRKHHTFLHPIVQYSDVTNNVQPTTSTTNAWNLPQATPSQANGAGATGHCGSTSTNKRARVSLRTVPVTVMSDDGRSAQIETYALLDPGSDVTLCTEHLVDELGLQSTPKDFSISTVNGQTTKRTGREVKLTIKGTCTTEVIDLDNVWTVDKLSISSQSIPTDKDIASWPHLNGIEISCLEDKEVTILIGSDIPDAHWALEQRRGKRGQPYAIRTPLGWTVMGPLGTAECDDNVSVNFLRRDDELLHQQVERMFTAEFNDPAVDANATMSLNDKKALLLMESTVKLVDGHYQLGLPWKDANLKLPNNRVSAERRLRSLKRRLLGDSRLLERYKETMNSYINDNHARELTDNEIADKKLDRIWYLPHHPVTHALKPNKVRVVFDCAARYEGTSLNDNLLQGPDLTNSLVGVLVRFRQELIALASDVKGMFHQVRVSPDDTDSLRFLWWPDGDLTKEPTDHQMLVHLFGATSSPSCASFSLRKTAHDNQNDYDTETIETVNKNFYVDDCLKSVPSTDEAIILVKQLRDLLSKGGFNLTKWNSNSKQVLATIPEKDRATSLLDLDLQEPLIQSTLGLQWNMQTDTFNFRTVEKEKAPTRRGILSTVSSMYDPLGFVAPIILPTKQLLQNLCSLNYSWDERVPESKLIEWETWLNNLPRLQAVSVPRCFKPPDFEQLREVQLHHFSDASQTGYGAVSYLRLIDSKDNIHCSFVIGKSRVAPMKTVTIPRLELSAAVVATKLNSIISQALDYHIDSTTYWTDSTSVLQYLRNQSRRFQTFVANRVSAIQESSQTSQWRYVNTAINPADIASRGINDCNPDKLNRWLRGPEFLWSHESTWPATPDVISELSADDPEVKKEVQVNIISKQEDKITTLFNRYSEWYRLQKAVAWIIRFKAYMCHKYLPKRLKGTLSQGPLTVHEITQATAVIVIHVQLKAFPDEYAILKTKNEQSTKPVSATSALRKLNPVLHNRLLRVGGRLEKASLPFDAKHPIIIPNKHHITDLLVRSYHVIAGHSGPTQVLATIRQKYWIIQGHSAVRRVIGNCVDCKKRNARPGKQMMAPLPAARLVPSEPPFTRVGVDYFGPLSVKQGRSRVKRYGCLFTCLSVRAVHVEIAHTLESDSFICAYQRFVARRGVPKEIFSDNGTNFKGAERELREALLRLNQDKIGNRLRRDEVQWHFNPPEASHQGGVWERMIRSVRKILRALLQEQIVSDETLLTLMAEVERILNDRPLTPVSDSPFDAEALTPNKILLLKSNASLPLDVVAKDDVYNKRWRAAQAIANAFWKRWIREYLPTLQLRQKWTVPHRNFKVGNLVLVVDDRVKRGEWPKGVVQEVYPDKHGMVRQLLVKTATTTLRRDVRKLCLLEGQLN